MGKRSVHIFFLGLLFTVASQAQKGPEVGIDTITVVEPPFYREEEDAYAFDSIGRQEPLLIRAVSKKVVDSLKAADDFWYANNDKTKRKKPAQSHQGNQKSLLGAKWFRSLLWAIILSSFTGVVFWYLISSNILVFRKGAKKIVGSESEDETTDDIFALNYEKEIAAASSAGHFRSAIRLWYLQTLKELAEKGLITYQYGRTNQHYVTQLGKTPFYDDFFRLTRNFEYTWYGQFNLSPEAYHMMQADFVNFKKGLR